jgi:hypothetical protein
MTLSIPASSIVAVTPGVVSAGGNPLSLNGLVLTNSSRVPIGTVASFPTQLAVAAFFGSTSVEASVATNYFSGFDNSNIKPGAILFAQYNTVNVGAYLRGGQVSGLSLTALQALTGVLVVVIDGVTKTSSSINLSAATSFSSAAGIINAALGAAGPAGGTFTGSIATTTLTVTSTPTAPIQIGDVLSGTGVTSGTYITGFLTGSGGTGTYTVSASQTASSTTITNTRPAVSYDSLSGAFVVASSTTGSASTIGFGSGSISAGLMLTQATGAVTSQGASAATPAGAMDQVVTQTQAWATFMTTWEPDTSTKVAFAAWATGQDFRYGYVMWDSDITVTEGLAPTSAGGQIIAAGDNGTFPLYDASATPEGAAFICGATASIDFTETNGRATMAFRFQGGLTPQVTNQTAAAELQANGYNYYGAWANATNNWNFVYPGSVTGIFRWWDSFINQIRLNSDLQTALMTLLTNVKSVPYNNAGYGLLRQACMDPINAALNFGSIRAGVPLSAAQAAEVNAAAGLAIDGILGTRGWYLQILPADAVTRAARKSPPMTLWYMDGQSVQSINLASILVQ